MSKQVKTLRSPRPTWRERLTFFFWGIYPAAPASEDDDLAPLHEGYDPAGDTSLRLIRSDRPHNRGVSYFVTQPALLKISGQNMIAFKSGDLVVAGPGRRLLSFESRPFGLNFYRGGLEFELTPGSPVPGPVIRLDYQLSLQAQVTDPLLLVSQAGTDRPEYLKIHYLEFLLSPLFDHLVSQACHQSENHALRNHGQNLALSLVAGQVLQGWGMELLEDSLNISVTLDRHYFNLCRAAFEVLSKTHTNRYQLLEQLLYGDANGLAEEALLYWGTYPPTMPAPPAHLDPIESGAEKGTAATFSPYQQFQALCRVGLAGDLLFEYARTLPHPELAFLLPEAQP
jgi:hypothetical protein